MYLCVQTAGADRPGTGGHREAEETVAEAQAHDHHDQELQGRLYQARIHRENVSRQHSTLFCSVFFDHTPRDNLIKSSGNNVRRGMVHS